MKIENTDSEAGRQELVHFFDQLSQMCEQMLVCRLSDINTSTKMSEGETASFDSVTMAELYEAQGYPMRAAQVYQRLLRLDPQNRSYQQHLRRLQKAEGQNTIDFNEGYHQNLHSIAQSEQVEIIDAQLNFLRTLLATIEDR